MRQRTNMKKVCSSFNYEESHRAHLNDLIRNHNEHSEELSRINSTIRVEPHYTEYKVWDKWLKMDPNAPEGVYDGFEMR